MNWMVVYNLNMVDSVAAKSKFTELSSIHVYSLSPAVVQVHLR